MEPENTQKTLLTVGGATTALGTIAYVNPPVAGVVAIVGFGVWGIIKVLQIICKDDDEKAKAA